jgi:hypothetical protein
MNTSKVEELINRLNRLSDLANPSPSTLNRILKSYFDDPIVYSKFWKLIDSFEPLFLPDGQQIATSFQHFIAFYQSPKVRETLRATPKNARRDVEEELWQPSGGFATVAHGPSISDMNSEIAAHCKGRASLAGLVVALAARCDHNHAAEFDASLNRICFLLDSSAEIKTSTSSIKTAWPLWRQVSPLWAGVMAESGYRPPNIKELCAILHVEERRARAIAYARWFASFTTRPRANGTLPPLINPEEVMKFETPIAECRPPLPPLGSSLREIARSYKTNIVETGIQKKSRKKQVV